MEERKSAKRLPYHAPELRAHGSMAELTQSSCKNGPVDGGTAPYIAEDVEFPGSR